jgi:outer membrane protein OmpA-like peptidoglycan-associated protein
LISGHTDNVGSEENNQVLSTNRARSVYTFLIENGISKDKLTYQGFGESKPVYDNSTSEGRSKNRRTECTIINK